LRNKLKNEIIIENFEEAAKIRDKIKKLEKNIYGR
jgi:protein-arginine kinase activator protein McsA